MIDTITATDLMALDIPEPKQVVHELFTVGLNILAGNPKAGKSFLALGLGVAVSNGTPAMSKLRTTRGSVLYLALEDNHFRLKHRMSAMKHIANPDLRFATIAPKLDNGGMEALDEYLTANPSTIMVVIDTLAKVNASKSGGNVYDEDSETAGTMHALAHDHQIALVVVTHSRKMAAGDFLHRVNGSSGLTGAADTVSLLSRNRNETTATLEVTGRDIREAKFDLEWYSMRGGWNVKSAAAPGFEDRRYGT